MYLAVESGRDEAGVAAFVTRRPVAPYIAEGALKLGVDGSLHAESCGSWSRMLFAAASLSQVNSLNACSVDEVSLKPIAGLACEPVGNAPFVPAAPVKILPFARKR